MMRAKAFAILLLCYVVYLIGGGAVFFFLENTLEAKKCKDGQIFYNSMKQVSSKNYTYEEIFQLLEEASSYRKHGIYMTKEGEISCKLNWNYPGCIFFAGTIITTIGYGHIVPTTDATRAFCVLYALVGIPMFAILFTGMAEMFCHCVKLALHGVDESSEKSSHRVLAEQSNGCPVIVIAAFGTLGFGLFCCVPAAAFVWLEGWSYSASLYYTVITLTTIGFGDFVAGDGTEDHYFPAYRLLVYLWILLGLGFSASFLALVSEHLKKRADALVVKRVDSSDDLEALTAAAAPISEEPGPSRAIIS